MTTNTSMTLDTLAAQVREFGRDHALGKDSLPKLAVVVMAAAVEGVVTLDGNKHGDGIDDAKFLYTQYSQAEAKKAVHEMTPDGVKAQVSKLRAIVKAGAASTPSTFDGVIEFDRVMNARKAKMTSDPKSVKPAYHAMVEAARKLVETQVPLTDEEIETIVSKGEPAEKSIEDELKQIGKRLEKLITGEFKGGKDQSEQVIKARELIDERLAALILTRETAQEQAEFERLAAKLAARQPILIAA